MSQISTSSVHLRSGRENQRHKMARELKSFDPTPNSSISLFQMQVKQLLADVSEKDNWLATIVDSKVKQLERIIQAVPAHSSVPV